jgi:hypothetical protein
MNLEEVQDLVFLEFVLELVVVVMVLMVLVMDSDRRSRRTTARCFLMGRMGYELYPL